jgi:hypothetical protein
MIPIPFDVEFQNEQRRKAAEQVVSNAALRVTAAREKLMSFQSQIDRNGTGAVGGVRVQRAGLEFDEATKELALARGRLDSFAPITYEGRIADILKPLSVQPAKRGRK